MMALSLQMTKLRLREQVAELNYPGSKAHTLTNYTGQSTWSIREGFSLVMSCHAMPMTVTHRVGFFILKVIRIHDIKRIQCIS